MKAPRSERRHIGIFGAVNAGKSSLLNALTGQERALVSEHEGTTTDPVFQPMELQEIGPVVFIDTAGFEDATTLGALRTERSKDVIRKTDLALVVLTMISPQTKALVRELQEKKVPILFVITKADTFDTEALSKEIRDNFHSEAITVSNRTKVGIEELRRRIIEQADPEERSITGDLVKRGDLVVLVMPQDKEAPKGRLILPQVQTLRELLDKGVIAVSVVPEGLADLLSKLKEAPKLIITDSQVFSFVKPLVPETTQLTSFSVLFAAYKGDAKRLFEAAKRIQNLKGDARILISEACTHAPKEEDIGTVKIPALLRKKFGNNIRIDFVRGNDFPKDVSSYDLIISCGSCMFNRKHVLTRQDMAEKAGVPMTNYGMTIAALTGILDDIIVPS